MGETLKRTLKRRTQAVDVDGKKLLVRELDGREREQYQKLIHDRTNYGPRGERLGMKEGGAGLWTPLLHLSVVDEQGVRIPESELDAWPTTLREELYILAADLSKLEGGGIGQEPQEGNGSTASGSTGSASPRS